MMKKIFLPLTPFLLGALVLLRWYDGTLVYYVASRYALLVAGGALFLVLLGVITPLFRHTLQHVKHHVHWWQVWFLLVPILFGFTITPAPLSAQTAVQRGIGQQLPIRLQQTPFSFAVDSSERTFGDWAAILFSYGDKTSVVGQEANISGFITTQGDDVYLTRFQVSCCAADGRPVGILLRPNTPVEENTWWSVEGIMQQDQEGEILLETTNMTPIDVPLNPYL